MASEGVWTTDRGTVVGFDPANDLDHGAVCEVTVEDGVIKVQRILMIPRAAVSHSEGDE